MTQGARLVLTYRLWYSNLAAGWETHVLRERKAKIRRKLPFLQAEEAKGRDRNSL